MKISDVTKEIVPFAADDKKIMLQFFYLFFKIMWAVLIASFLLIFYAADWKLPNLELVMIGWLPTAILINVGIFVWYLSIKKQFKNANKIIITGKVTDKFIWNGKYSKFTVYLGKESKGF